VGAEGEGEKLRCKYTMVQNCGKKKIRKKRKKKKIKRI